MLPDRRHASEPLQGIGGMPKAITKARRIFRRSSSALSRTVLSRTVPCRRTPPVTKARTSRKEI